MRGKKRIAITCVAITCVAIMCVAIAILIRQRVLPRPLAVTSAPRVLERAPLRPGHATLLFAGDTGLGDAAESTLIAQGYDYPFRATIDLLQSADVSIANAEMPITDRGERFPLYKDYIYRSDPKAATALAAAGFDVLTLANNHSMDYGLLGLLSTTTIARTVGMETTGGGSDEDSARRGLVMKIGDVRVGLLAYCEHQFMWALWVDQFAHGDHGGTAALSEAALRDDIARLRPQVDLLVVALHIGENYEAPTERAIRWSKRAVELGADLVVDHHPHVAHPMMLYRGVPIALSLGNFAFGTPGHSELELGEVLIAEIEGKHLQRIELLPIAVQNRTVEYQPHLLVGAELDKALDSLIRDSNERAAPLVREGDRAVLHLPTRP